MKRALKWAGLALGGVLVLLLIVVAVLYTMGRSRLNTTHAVEAETVALSDDSATLARGEHLVVAVSACGECHGEGLGGKAFIEDPMLGTIVSANLTPAEGSPTADYSTEDWVRAIRHAVGSDAKPLIAMPSTEFIHMSRGDLGAVISYLKTIPPVSHDAPATALKPMAYIMVALGALDEAIPVEFIDHDAPFPRAPPEGATAEYGEYLVSIATCQDCHGDRLAGGQAGPGEPIGPNVTPAGRISDWSRDDFIHLMRTGELPSGRRAIDFMPWRHYREMTDVELNAIWRYLRSLDPVETPAEFARSG